MSAPSPLVFQWSGDAMIPAIPRLADKQYVVGERYRLAPVEERSLATHNHFFASVADAHANLPEDAAERFPTPDHLRRWALIKAGYRDERSIVCASKAEAQRIAAFVKPMDDYAVIVARDAVVMVLTAKSQSMKAMGKKDFAASKEAVLAIVAELIGAKPDQLGNAA
jgi:hypothetical protein